MAECLRLAGLDVGHEREGKDGAVSSVWCAPYPPYPSYHQQGPRPEFDIILHQVRHPEPTIGSITTASAQSWAFNRLWVPINDNDTLIQAAAKYWFWWNERAEYQAKMTYCVENLQERWPVIMALIGHNAPYTGDQVSQRTNSRPHADFMWADIKRYIPFDLARNIEKMAARYGYKLKGGFGGGL